MPSLTEFVILALMDYLRWSDSNFSDLVMSERGQWVNGRGSDSRKQDSERGRNSERGDRAEIGVEITGADTEEKLFEKPPQLSFSSASCFRPARVSE